MAAIKWEKDFKAALKLAEKPQADLPGFLV
jgi:hypothetical protein